MSTFFVKKDGVLQAATQLDIDQLTCKAAIDGNLKELKGYVEGGAKINHVNLIINAYLVKEMKIIEYLLDRDQKMINKKSKSGNTVLSVAVSQDRMDLALYLLSKGATINFGSLKRVIKKGNFKIIQCAVKRGIVKKLPEDMYLELMNVAHDYGQKMPKDAKTNEEKFQYCDASHRKIIELMEVTYNLTRKQQ